MLTVSRSMSSRLSISVSRSTAAEQNSDCPEVPDVRAEAT
jgi:hypothetical protein